MKTTRVEGGGPSFDLAVLEAHHPSRIALFAAGGGGDPARYGALLAALAERGCTVVAPSAERMTAHPTEEQLLERARRLRRAVEVVERPELPVVGVGHSIGAMLLLALAGARAWLGPSRPLPLPVEPRLTRVALLAPTTGWFDAPGAWDSVTPPVLAWAGGADAMTPPLHCERVARALEGRVAVELRVTPEAGHFTFMDAPPPGVPEPHPDRAAFLAAVADEVGRFVSR